MAKLFHEESGGSLRKLFEREVLDWPGVTTRKMFGCPAYRVDGTLFAFVIDEGLVLTQLPEAERRELIDRVGAQPFDAGRQTIARWVVLPVPDEDALGSLLEHVRQSYDIAQGT